MAVLRKTEYAGTAVGVEEKGREGQGYACVQGHDASPIAGRRAVQGTGCRPPPSAGWPQLLLPVRGRSLRAPLAPAVPGGIYGRWPPPAKAEGHGCADDVAIKIQEF